jgi:predicted  nucleic acid-binding Zn-ribbon protein
LWFIINKDENELRGSYIHPKLVHHVAEWADLKYAVKVGKIMDAINENNNEKLNIEITELRNQNEKIKSEIIELTNKNEKIANKYEGLTVYSKDLHKNCEDKKVENIK